MKIDKPEIIDFTNSQHDHSDAENGGVIVIVGGELTANKQDSLAVDGTGILYPTVDAVNDEFYLIKSQINPNTYVVVDEGYTQVVQDITINADWEWKINNVDYTNPAPVVINIPLATSGYSRIDLIVLNASNTAVRVAGTESNTVPVAPTVLIDTIAILFLVTDSVATTAPTTPSGKNQVSQLLRDGETKFAPSENVVFDALALKLDAADYNQYFKGVHLTEAALNAAHPTGFAGATAQVNEIGASAVVNYNWDVEAEVWVMNATSGGSGAANTDELPEGSSNLYFTVARFLANLTAANIKTALGITTLSGANTGDQDLSGKEDTSNKSQDIETDKASTTKYSSVKQLYDWAMSKFKLWTYGINIIPGTTYQFAIDDYKKQNIFTSATAVTLTVPTNAVTAIPIGSEIYYSQKGAGVVTLVAPGVTINTSGPLTSSLNETKILIKTDVNEWNLMSCTNGDMILATEGQNVTGLKTFFNGKFALRNAANTFSITFTNAVTAARAVVWPDKGGTVAMTSDIVAQLNGTVNRLVKFGTATTGVNSRVEDTGTFLGIETLNAPTKDITLSNQRDAVFGVEESINTIQGRSLTVEAGKAVNYAPSTFYAMQQTPFISGVLFSAISVTSNNEIWAFNYWGGIYRKLNVGSNFANIGNLTGGTNPVQSCLDSSDNIYIATSTKIIKKPVGGTTSYDLGFTTRSYSGVVVTPSGNLYCCVNGGDIYMQTGGVGALVALNQTVRGWGEMAAHPNGNVYAICDTGVYMQTNGTGNFNLIYAGSYASGVIACAPNGDVYLGNGATLLRKQVSGTGTFNAESMLNAPPAEYPGLAIGPDGSLYLGHKVGSGVNDVYTRTNNLLGTANLDGGTLKMLAGTGKGTGKSRYEVYTGQKLGSGTDMQIPILREYIDENGYHVHAAMPVYADNAAALSGGLPVGCEYRTATGDRKIVY